MNALNLILVGGFAVGLGLMPSCAGDSTKKVVPADSDGGAAESGASGESASGSAGEAGADNASGTSSTGGSGNGGNSGSGAEAGSADVEGTAGALGGASGAAGEAAMGGEGGLACGAPGTPLRLGCAEITAQWSPHCDPEHQAITFDVGSLAHGIVHGVATYFYELPEASAISTGGAATAVASDGKTLSIQLVPATAAASRITIAVLDLTDDCGNVVRLDPGTGACHVVQLTPSGAAGWTVGCGVLTGTVCPSCA